MAWKIPFFVFCKTQADEKQKSGNLLIQHKCLFAKEGNLKKEKKNYTMHVQNSSFLENRDFYK